jgi:TRAP-type C4-dicarboxylate transport system permease small subunit
VVPVGFTLMGVRFLAQAFESFAGKVEEDDALYMLGLQQETRAAGHDHMGGEEDPL